MIVIHKFILTIDDKVEAQMPVGAEVRHLGPGMLPDQVAVWAQVDDEDTAMETRVFYICGTGHEVPTWADYLGTVVAPPFVWHVYE